jgi:hypothetical protein
LTDAVARIRQEYYAWPPAIDSELDIARRRGVPEALLKFYSLCNGAFIAKGTDFPGPDRRRYRFSIPPLRDLTCAQDEGYISESQPLFDSSADWWQLVDYGDGNWLAVDATPAGNGRIIDLFHETVGEVGEQAIVATSIVDLLTRLLDAMEVYWLDESFEDLGSI